uniref:Uncharacterized protein n=1 Tax=Anguilla anguilla TaxID=7936 RepID=A0A0E9S8F2_ANGAN
MYQLFGDSGLVFALFAVFALSLALLLCKVSLWQFFVKSAIQIQLN